MAVQFSVTVRNARLDAIETAISTAPTLEIRTGAPPANCAAADSGSVIATLTLPSDWMGAANAGAKALAGSWTATVTAGGTVGHFRVKQSTTCHMQGTVTATGGGGDMTVTNGAPSTNDTITVNTFTLTDGNA